MSIASRAANAAGPTFRNTNMTLSPNRAQPHDQATSAASVNPVFDKAMFQPFCPTSGFVFWYSTSLSSIGTVLRVSVVARAIDG